MKKLLILVPICILISGCAASFVQANVTSFYVDDFQPGGSISVISADPEMSNSLEFAHYRKRFEAHLAANGYSIAQDVGTADYVALVTFGIDDGTSKTVSAPIIGQTSGGTTYTRGVVTGSGGTATYSGTSYTIPTYGVVGVATGSRTTYKRAIAIDIVDGHSLLTGNPKVVYEGRVKSEGSCNVIVEVFDEMLQVMFTDWPGESGKNRNRRVNATFDC